MAHVNIQYSYECDACGAEQYTTFELRTDDLVACGDCGSTNKVESVSEDVRPC